MEKTRQEIIDFYDSWASRYDFDIWRWGYKTPEKLAALIEDRLQLGMSAVDLGCGTGLNSLEYIGYQLDWHGVDQSSNMLRFAAQRGYKTYEADIRATPFEDDSFDLSICTAVLEHLEDKLPCLKEMRRIVSPEGLVTFTVPCTTMDGRHMMKKKELETLIEKAGFPEAELRKIHSHNEHADPKETIYFWAAVCENEK